MLREHQKISQREGEGRRRWFLDDYFDLIVWYEPGDEEQVVGFQLCYSKNRNEHALTWKRRGGFTHSGVDDGDFGRRTPILVPDGIIPIENLIRRFSSACGIIDPVIAQLVLERLYELT